MFVKQPDNSTVAYDTAAVFKRAVQIVPENDCVAKGVLGNHQIGQEMLSKYKANNELAQKIELEQAGKTSAEAKIQEEEDRLVRKLQDEAKGIMENTRQARIKEIENSKLSNFEKSDEIYKLNKTINSDKYYWSVLYPLYRKAGLEKYVRE